MTPVPAISGLLDRALGSFLGLAVGDALGATVEFMSAPEIAAQYKVHNQIIGGGWLGLRPGRVTDDTEMALALGSALIASGGWNLPAIADAFVRWMRRPPVDIGNTCRRGIANYVCHRRVVRAVFRKQRRQWRSHAQPAHSSGFLVQRGTCLSSAALNRRT